MVNSIRETLVDLVSVADDAGFYIDFNYMNSSSSNISLDKVNTEIDKSSDLGIKIRLWDGEKFLESATTSLDLDELKEIVNSLISQGLKNKTALSEPIELQFDSQELVKDFGRDALEDIALEERVDSLKSIMSEVEKLDSDIVNVRVVLMKEFEEHIFVNKYKNLLQKIPINLLIAVAIVNTSAGVKTVYKALVDEDFSVFDRFDKELNKLKEDILIIKKAISLENGGKHKVILSPKLSGLLAHESFGHGMEADTMMRGRALATDWIGKEIAPSNVSIVDYPQITGKHGSFYFDHEGNLANKIYLVKNGVVNEPMADLYSKSRLGLTSASSSRFESFDHKNYVRMSNTYFEPGEDSFEELISKVEDGIYIFDCNGGMEDPKTWGVQLQGCTGQRIKDGKLVDEYFDGFSFTGFLPEIMKNISGVSSDFEIEGGGNCGKGHKEWVRVAEGGPHLLIDEVTLG